MSRIEDVFKRIAGATSDHRTASALERYAPEEPSADEEKVTTFVPAGPHAVETKHQSRQKAPTPVEPAAPTQQARRAETVSEAEGPASQETLIDFGQLFDYAGFLVRSLRRHWVLVSAAFAFAFGLTIAATVLMPKTYHVTTKMLAQRNSVITSLSNPGRPIPWDADAPTRAAAETVLRRDNLIDLIERTDLIRNWELKREPILRLKDWIMATVTGYRPTEEDKRDAMIGLLDNNLFVTAGPVGDGTVTIDLNWRDPEMGFQLVEVAQQSFLDARAKAEKTAIDESIRILEDHAQELTANISATLAELERTQSRRTSGSTRRRVTREAVSSRLSPPLAGDVAVPSLAAAIGLSALSDVLDTDPEVARLGTTINLKKQELARLETEKDRQVADLQTQLTRLRQVYTSSYPAVITAQHNLDAASQDSPQLVALRKDVEKLERELRRRENEATDRQIQAARERRAAAPPPPQPTAQPAEQQIAASVPVVEAPANNEAADFATLRLRSELNQYESVLERTASAKIELTVSQAAFKYKYTVIRPAEIPKEPIKPNINRILVAGFGASLIVGLLAAVGKDFLSNKILEAWQIERQLGLPVLGTLETV